MKVGGYPILWPRPFRSGFTLRYWWFGFAGVCLRLPLLRSSTRIPMGRRGVVASRRNWIGLVPVGSRRCDVERRRAVRGSAGVWSQRSEVKSQRSWREVMGEQDRTLMRV